MRDDPANRSDQPGCGASHQFSDAVEKALAQAGRCAGREREHPRKICGRVKKKERGEKRMSPSDRILAGILGAVLIVMGHQLLDQATKN